jgi:hypothetical protein
MTPEQKARVSIDALLVAAGWHVCNVSDANIHAADGAGKLAGGGWAHAEGDSGGGGGPVAPFLF